MASSNRLANLFVIVALCICGSFVALELVQSPAPESESTSQHAAAPELTVTPVVLKPVATKPQPHRKAPARVSQATLRLQQIGAKKQNVRTSNKPSTVAVPDPAEHAKPPAQPEPTELPQSTEQPTEVPAAGTTNDEPLVDDAPHVTSVNAEPMERLAHSVSEVEPESQAAAQPQPADEPQSVATVVATPVEIQTQSETQTPSQESVAAPTAVATPIATPVTALAVPPQPALLDTEAATKIEVETQTADVQPESPAIANELTIYNETGEAVDMMIDSTILQVQPGTPLTLSGSNARTIRFIRGKRYASERKTVAPGTYRIVTNEQSWDLVPSSTAN